MLGRTFWVLVVVGRDLYCVLGVVEVRYLNLLVELYFLRLVLLLLLCL